MSKFGASKFGKEIRRASLRYNHDDQSVLRNYHQCGGRGGWGVRGGAGAVPAAPLPAGAKPQAPARNTRCVGDI